MKKIFYILCIVFLLVLMVSCGDSITTDSDLTTSNGTTTSADVTSSTTVRLAEIDQFMIDHDPVWCGPLLHEIVCAPKFNENDNTVAYENTFRFAYDFQNNIFKEDIFFGAYGIQMTEPICVFIKNTNDAEYVRYDIEYYETPSWWEVWFVPKGFKPVEDESYQFVLFIQTDDSSIHNYPERVLYFKNDENAPWTYEVPVMVPPEENILLKLIPDLHERTQLSVDTLSIDENGYLTYTFKTDNSPFHDVGDIRGLSKTKPGKLMINGATYTIAADSYLTESNNIIKFRIEGFVPQKDIMYEVIFSIDSDDTTPDYCSNPNGYFALNVYRVS